jgi:DNA-binding response OmpR family regulator
MRVLLLTRSFAVSGLLAEVLMAEGHELRAVASGREGLTELRSGAYAAVIVDGAVDWDVPVAALARLVPVLVLAAAGAGRRQPMSGVVGVLDRPIDEDAVRRAVGALVGRREGRGAAAGPSHARLAS